jgi:hypothetical protein
LEGFLGFTSFKVLEGFLGYIRQANLAENKFVCENYLGVKTGIGGSLFEKPTNTGNN